MNMSQYAQMIRQLKTPEVMKRLNTLYGQREGMMVAQSTRYTALLKRHEDLFKRGITRPFPQSDHGGIHRNGTRIDTAEGIGVGKAEIVVGMHLDRKEVHLTQ